ncbi:MAG: hypothetical protein KBD19_02230 [Candidatus Moranbacteria bacterium]|nr:hypothetical protein [Candidatus Moranbacteria bacterium]
MSDSPPDRFRSLMTASAARSPRGGERFVTSACGGEGDIACTTKMRLERGDFSGSSGPSGFPRQASQRHCPSLKPTPFSCPQASHARGNE